MAVRETLNYPWQMLYATNGNTTKKNLEKKKKNKHATRMSTVKIIERKGKQKDGGGGKSGVQYISTCLLMSTETNQKKWRNKTVKLYDYSRHEMDVPLPMLVYNMQAPLSPLHNLSYQRALFFVLTLKSPNCQFESLSFTDCLVYLPNFCLRLSA